MDGRRSSKHRADASTSGTSHTATTNEASICTSATARPHTYAATPASHAAIAAKPDRDYSTPTAPAAADDTSTGAPRAGSATTADWPPATADHATNRAGRTGTATNAD